MPYGKGNGGKIWTPGFRRVPPTLQRRIGKHMLAFASISNLTMRLMRNPEKESTATEKDLADDSPVETGDMIVLSFQNTYKKFALVLTTLNREELDALRGFINLAFEKAGPIVDDRDHVAEEAANRGEDVFYRRHRPAPKVSVFEGASGGHAPSVPNRPQDVLAGDGPSGGDRSGGSGGAGGDVADQSSPDHGAEDNSS